MKIVWPSLCCLLGTFIGIVPAAHALPGESVRAVEEWMKTNPTLSPKPNERLLINRSDTPAQRFTFQASVFPVTGLSSDISSNLIRTERFTLVDLINPMDQNRMEESLRAIYGPEIYTDYRRGTILYQYPDPFSILPDNPNLVLQGEVREGARYAYWLELSSTPFGATYSGRMAIFLKSDLPALLEQLGATPVLPEGTVPGEAPTVQPEAVDPETIPSLEMPEEIQL